MEARKITIEPVTRIEGHGRVTIHLNEQGAVEQTFFHVDEFRGLEKFCEGRPYFEMTHLTQRICGICPVSHHLASAKACDGIARLEPPQPAKLLRELMHMGQMIQSHGMHFFHLAAPDLVFGFDADPATRNVFGIIKANPELALKAVNLRRYGQQIIERLGAKRVHPNFAVPGGVNNPLSKKDRDAIAKERDAMIDIAKTAVAIGKNYLETNHDLAMAFASFPSNYMGLVDREGGLQLYDGEIRVKDTQGKLVAQFKPEHYLSHVAEHVESWSFLKYPYYRKLGWPDGTYRVGPLGRLNVIDKIGTPLAQEEFKLFKQINGGKPVEGSLFYHYARLIELVYALERVGELLDDPMILSTDVRAYPTTDKIGGQGVGVIEAPRGTLFHDYSTDENGLLTRINLIVATGNNNWAMHTASGLVAKAFVDGNKLTEGMLNRVEAAIRCYDPCLSCATHALGQMPLEVTLIAADGAVLDRISR
ncbi:MAG: NAD-reducing hydrogenase HoxS subunit beta [Syntrophaceae bacterium PtaU1.Bin231]|jgi:NAD-reducing hydrogenase large subunit|nr:MAG: NAD-reducing hydrogenase HoxS subunit beta [Syntrophaceae bacterium PtaU1.Bin231]